MKFVHSLVCFYWKLGERNKNMITHDLENEKFSNKIIVKTLQYPLLQSKLIAGVCEISCGVCKDF